MKRFVLIFVCFLLLIVSACSSPLDLTGEDGAERILDISKDPEPWLGREIVFAGYYAYEDFGIRYHYVLLGKDAAGNNPGFESRWNGDFPESGAPVKVRGELKEVTEFGQKYIYLELSDLTLLQPVE